MQMCEELNELFTPATIQLSGKDKMRLEFYLLSLLLGFFNWLFALANSWLCHHPHSANLYQDF